MAAVRGPRKVVDILRGLGEALGLSAAETEEPGLGSAVVSFGEEGDGFAVGAPSRMRGGDSFGSERDGVAAGSRDHPDALFVLVGLEDGGLDGVGDPLCVRAQLRVVDGADPKIVVNGDGAGRGNGLLGKNEWDEDRNRKKNGKTQCELHPK